MRHEQDVIDQLADYFDWLDARLDNQPVVDATLFASQRRHSRNRLITQSVLGVAAAGLLCVVIVSRVSDDSGARRVRPNTQAAATPNMRLSGNAMPAAIKVSLIADNASGSASAAR